MNPITATVDTQIPSYSSIGSVNALDDVKLTLEVLTNGVIDTPWTSPIFELIGVKSDKNEVRQTDGFEVLDLNGRKVKIKLKEQFLTAPGMIKMQLIIKDSGRTSSTVFFLYAQTSLDQDIVKSIRDVEVLDQLDLYVAQGFHAIDEATEITGQLKKEMTEINTEASESEKKRQASELTRNQRELMRVDNEEDRVANEIERVDNENERITNEEERVANENTRITNENNRRTHENTRISQEAARQESERQRNAIFEDNENIRNEQENTRIKSENERKKKFTTWEDRETIRLKSEENRILQEQERVSNEEDRKRQESTRQEQENYRQRTYTQFNEAEASRVNNEIQREISERQRQQAETDRDAAYQSREDNRDVEYGKAEEVRNIAFEQKEANRQNEYTVAERDRVESEELRKGRERDRENAETKRQEAETARANSESGRVERFNQEIENARNTMDTATSNVNNAILEANDTMQGIERRAEDCLPIIEKSASAKVDYMGNEHNSIKDAMDANVEFVLDEVNTVYYEGQHIIATDTIERQVKSAILKGNTLVNLCAKFNKTFTPNGTWIHIGTSYNGFIGGRKYLVIPTITGVSFNFQTTNNIAIIGVKEKIVFTYPINGDGGVHYYCNNDLMETEITPEFIVLEYQDGMENWDIPYFEGMQSVKMPVLTTTGKNICSGYIIGGLNSTTGEEMIGNSNIVTSFILIDNTNSYYISGLAPRSWNYVAYYDSNKQFIRRSGGGDYRTRLIKSSDVQTYTSAEYEDVIPSNAKYIRLTSYPNASAGEITIEELVEFSKLTQIEQGTVATPFEPYKSNILSTPSDLVLRKIGDVQDTLDVNTGEVVQHIGEVVLDGSNDEEWTLFQRNDYDTFTTRQWRYTLPQWGVQSAYPGEEKKSICDKLPFGPLIPDESEDYEHYRTNGSKPSAYVYIWLNQSKASTVSELKAYLQQNPIKIQYQLFTPIIKIVDLKGQRVYSYDGVTHYTCSSEEGSLVPNLSIDVPTNLPALVSRQRETIQTLSAENEALKDGVVIVDQQREDGDVELLGYNFDLDFRLLEIECALDLPMTLSARSTKGANDMNTYKTAKTLILAGNYEREDMEYKLSVYLKRGRLTQEEYDELIALMDARELVA